MAKKVQVWRITSHRVCGRPPSITPAIGFSSSLFPQNCVTLLANLYPVLAGCRHSHASVPSARGKFALVYCRCTLEFDFEDEPDGQAVMVSLLSPIIYANMSPEVDGRAIQFVIRDLCLVERAQGDDSRQCENKNAALSKNFLFNCDKTAVPDV